VNGYPNGFPKWFVHRSLLQALPDFQAIAADKATTMGHIKHEHLESATLVLPARDVLLATDRKFQAIYDRHLSNELETRKLAESRDYLLPRLLSGEIGVGRGEKMTEAVL